MYQCLALSSLNLLKKGKKVQQKGTAVNFYPSFSKFRAFRTLHLPKQYVFLEFLVKNKAFHFSKRALRADTTRKKRFKKALPGEKLLVSDLLLIHLIYVRSARTRNAFDSVIKPFFASRVIPILVPVNDVSVTLICHIAPSKAQTQTII